MKETSKQILEELILGERDWDAIEVIQAMEEDPELASAVGATRKTLAALATHAGQIDDLPMGSIQVSTEDRAATHAALAPRSKSPILRHGIWLLPSAAAAVLLFSYMQENPVATENAPHSILGGSGNNGLPIQKRTGFKSFDLGSSMPPGTIARIECFASDLEDSSLFTTGQIKQQVFQLTPEQLAKLEGLDRVWVVIEWEQSAGHSRTSPGQWWVR